MLVKGVLVSADIKHLMPHMDLSAHEGQGLEKGNTIL